jgi:NADPH:quinone reductase-like Zn-dependent oxidoreductase
VYFVVEPNCAQLVEIAALVDAGDLRPTIDTVYPLAQARAAFERSLGVHGAGKIVLSVANA